MSQVNFIGYEYTVQFGYKKISPKPFVMCVGGECPVTVSLLELFRIDFACRDYDCRDFGPDPCEDVRVTFSFEASMLSEEWHVLWNVTDKRVWVKYK